MGRPKEVFRGLGLVPKYPLSWLVVLLSPPSTWILQHMLNTSNSTLGGSSISLSSIPSMLCSSSNTMLSMGLPLVNQHLLLLLPLLTFLLVMEVILSTINLITLVMVPHHLNKASRSRQQPNKKIENHELTCIFISIHYMII